MMPAFFSIHRMFFAVAVLAVSGCAHFTAKPLSPAVAASDFDARRLSTKHASLSKLVAEAMEKNPELAVLRSHLQTVQAAVATAGERPNPVLSLKPGYNSSTSGISPWIIEPGLDLTIETGGKREARQAEAIAKVRAARLEIEVAAWKVRSDIRRAMFVMYSADATRTEFRSHESAQAQATTLLESQLKDGAARPQDVAAARIPLNQTRLGMHDADLLAAKGRAQLAAAVGVPASALAGVEFEFSEVSKLPSAPAGRAARRHALTHRADILAALADYAAGEEHLRLEVAKQYPDIKLGPGYKLDQTSNKWTLGVGFELPILNQHKGAIGEAEAKRTEAAARFRAVQARALGEIDIALAVYRAATGKATAAKALATDVRAQTKTAETMKAAGELSQLDVSQRRVEQGAAELSRTQARLGALEALGALEDALQTPSSLWK